MRRLHKKKGVITVFSAVSFALTVSLFLSLLESARIQGMRYFYPEYVHLQAENVLAHYDTDIYERFGLFGRLNDGMIEDTLNEYLNREEELNERDLLRGKSANVETLNYKLMTDDEGKAFQHLAASYMKSIIPDVFSDKADELMDNFSSIAEYIDGSKILGLIDKAVDAVLRALAIAQSMLYKMETDADGNEITVEDPEIRAIIDRLNSCEILEAKNRIEHFSLLNLIPSGLSISKGRKLYYDPIEKRELRRGTMEPILTDRIEYALMLLYARSTLKSYLDQYANFSEDEEGEENKDGLIYELEYVCAGHDTDEENLSHTVKKIYILRTAVRFMTNMVDARKLATAESLATMLVGFTGLLFLIPIVKTGLIICWSLMEAVTDCKVLLSGKRVALVPYVNADVVQLNYVEHVALLLVSKGTKTMSYRIMDIIEEYSREKMDDMIVAIEGNVSIHTDFKIARAILMIPVPLKGVNDTYDYYSKYYR